MTITCSIYLSSIGENVCSSPPVCECQVRGISSRIVSAQLCDTHKLLGTVGYLWQVAYIEENGIKDCQESY